MPSLLWSNRLFWFRFSCNEDIEQGLGKTMSTKEAINTLVKSYKSSTAYQQLSSKICGRDMPTVGEQYWRRREAKRDLLLNVMFLPEAMDPFRLEVRSALMFVASLLTFMAIGEFPSFVEDMKIFTRERLNGHYGVGAFVVGNTFSSLPYLILISVIPGAIAYYLPNDDRRKCGTRFPHGNHYRIAGIQGVMMLDGGFFRLPSDLPKPFWRYPMFYISFTKYAIQGFYKNEFEGLTFPNDKVGGPPTITGDEILRNTWEVEMGYSKWVDVVILLGMAVLYRLMFLGIIKVVEK
ncbi:hypothetical protein C3L33_18098, partial [Rhododendron williamsianum]